MSSPEVVQKLSVSTQLSALRSNATIRGMDADVARCDKVAASLGRTAFIISRLIQEIKKYQTSNETTALLGQIKEELWDE